MCCRAPPPPVAEGSDANREDGDGVDDDDEEGEEGEGCASARADNTLAPAAAPAAADKAVVVDAEGGVSTLGRGGTIRMPSMCARCIIIAWVVVAAAAADG